LDGNWYEAEESAPQTTDPEPSEALSTAAPPARPAERPGAAVTTRFYAVATIIVPPVFVVVFGLVGISALAHPGPRVIGIFLTAIAVLAAYFGLRTPYVAVAGQDGSIVFKALLRSKETSISRVSRIWLRTGNRSATWIFDFDGMSAALGDPGGKALARYVIDRNPSVDYPQRRFKQ